MGSGNVNLVGYFNFIVLILCTLLITLVWALVVAIAHIVVTFIKPNMDIIKGINHIGDDFVHINIGR